MYICTCTEKRERETVKESMQALPKAGKTIDRERRKEWEKGAREGGREGARERGREGGREGGSV